MMLVVMGRYTPVFKWLCVILPWFFRFPHAVYYRFGICWSLAVLAGIGASCLWNDSAFRARMTRWWVPGICVVVAIAGVAFELLRETPLLIGPRTAMMVPGYRTLSAYGEWQWFLGGPMLYFAVASICLLGGMKLLSPKGRVKLLTIGMVVETATMAGLMTYVGVVSVQRRTWPELQSQYVDGRFDSLADYPPFQMTERMNTLAAGANVRWACQNGAFDNQTWGGGGRALLGYAAKPLLPTFERLTKEITVGWPYRLDVTEPRVSLLQNMNVAYFVRLGQRDNSANMIQIDDNFSCYKLPDPLPYVYTQDHVESLIHEKQLEQLIATDLHNGVFVTPEVATEIENLLQPNDRNESPKGYYELQEINRVEASWSGPNRVVVTASTRKASMLVIAECWHPAWRASLDGQKVPLWQVNYLQQGLWLPAGQHKIELVFAPTGLRSGAYLSTAFGVVYLCIVIFGYARHIRSKRSA
jgi:hypothetical protein